MKKFFFLLFLVASLPFHSFPQDTITQATVSHKPFRAPNRIKSGFYLKIGPSFPIGNFKLGQTLFDTVSSTSKNSSKTINRVTYFPSKMGFAMDMGFLIYIGPAFAGNHLRAGIDASFIALSYNPTTNLPDTADGSKSKYWFYYLGQKFGPVLSICPVDRLVIDLSYKLNAYVAFVHHPIGNDYKSEFGKNLTQNEISMNIRYSLILFSFEYNFGKTSYNNFSTDNPMHTVDNTTYRIMVGFKF
jgi:hypothetical protein